MTAHACTSVGTNNSVDMEYVPTDMEYVPTDMEYVPTHIFYPICQEKYVPIDTNISTFTAVNDYIYSYVSPRLRLNGYVAYR